MDVIVGAAATDTRMRLASLAREAGHYVLAEASSGADALEAAEELLPDALLCDLVLPVLDGAALLQRLESKRLPFAPALVLRAPCGLGRGIPALLGAAMAEEFEGLSPLLDAAAMRSMDPLSRRAVHEKLQDLGLSPHMRGKTYAQQALLLCLADARRLKNLRDCVYAPLAQAAGVSPMSVERDVRYAIESAWRYGHLRALDENFGYTVLPDRGKPTNRAFLAQMTDGIRRSIRAGEEYRRRNAI